MKIAWLGLIAFSITACASKNTVSQTPAPEAAVSGVPAFLTGIHQLTFEGRRAGEGYFSHDGRYLVFQSEREKDNPFYQIYLLDQKDGSVRRISPGQGKTTCAWINPDNKRILFASTHADPELKKKTAEEWESRKKPQGKYAWNFDEAFDIYETDFNGSHYKNLTHSPGYDAEGSYSPDGKWIAFASNRAAYTAPMSKEQKELFARDASTMMDIYIMRADGTQVKRLTTAPGYDGGPFFSPNGQRIVYRRFATDGMTAEVHSMNIDGSDDKELTHLKAMSWAPFYHPSGDYIIFATNKLGFKNFELYMVDREGRYEPVRVTDLPGFDGLPVFSPDGKTLTWTHTAENGDTQLYRGNWNDALARQAFALDPAAPRVNQLSTAIDAGDARAWVEYLASNRLAGRATGSPEEHEYLGVISTAFKDLGLQPTAGGDYLQKYEFTSGIEFDHEKPTAIELQLGGVTQHPVLNADWVPLSYSKTGRFATAGLVFAGYGMVAPAAGKQAAYDSYANLDVKDKWVVVFSGLPDDIDNDRRFFLHTYSRLEHKALMARTHGALGLVVVEDAVTPSPKMNLVFEGRNDDAGLPVLRLSPKQADALFASAHSSRTEWTKKLSHGETLTFAFAGMSLQADVNLRLNKSVAHNALGLLRVPGATSTVVIGAHGDHLGKGERGNSLWRGGGGDSIHHGADDNASGVAGVMEIAKDLSSKVKAGTVKLKQNVLFAVWTGEEIGILGSSYFVKNSAPLKISAYLNMDMIGRYRNELSVQGTASAPEWKRLVEKVSAGSPLNIRAEEDPYLPSDALTFYMRQYPVLMTFTGSHAQYHTPADTADLINYDGLAKVASWTEQMAVTLASSPRSLVTYNKVEGSQRRNESRGLRLYLGTVPDYTQESKTGVRITGTSKDSPAEKAGLQAGDTILELGGMKIQNIYDYVYCLQALKANQPTVLRFLRAGKEKQIEVTPVIKAE